MKKPSPAMPIKNLFRYWTFQVFSPGTVLREKYESFKRLLEYDKRAHNSLAVLEEIYYNQKKKDFQTMAAVYQDFAASVSGMVEELAIMCPSRYWSLKDYFKKFNFYVRFMLAPPAFEFTPPYTIDLDHKRAVKEAVAGKKAAILARLSRELHLPVPQGFIITTNAFHYFMEANALTDPVNEKLAALDIHDIESLEQTAAGIQKMIMDAEVPDEIESHIKTSLNRLTQTTGPHQPRDLRLALRSSAVKEDGQASFAGQYKSLMNIKKTQILEGYKEILAGKYGPAALFYRISAGIADHDTPMAVLVLEMKDAQAAGIMYTRDIETPAPDRIMIHSVWGQGGLLVEGRVSPDRIRVIKPDKTIDAIPGDKDKEMCLNRDTGTQVLATDPSKRNRISLDNPDILTLARWGTKIEACFACPQDIEWCKDRSGRLFLLQSRPLNSPTDHFPGRSKQVAAQDSDPVPLSSGGETICAGIASGPVFRLETLNQLKNIPEGAIVLAAHALPEFVTAIHKMAGLIIKTGSTAGHFASIAREFNLPAMVAPKKATTALDPGQIITLDAGDCRIYEGRIAVEAKASETQTDIFVKSDFMTRLAFVIKFCAELRLTDPTDPGFTPEGCRSHHDIIRFVHETAMKEMFLQGQHKGSRKKGARQLNPSLPMLFYVLDVGSKNEAGTDPKAVGKKILLPEDIQSLPMKSVLKGLSHPGICWDETQHFDWESYDKIIMAGGIISPDNPQFGSYAVVARTYANINLRFGYHFVIIDGVSSPFPEDNYVLFRFSGGGGSLKGRWLRARFIAGILEHLDFMVDIRSDLIEARTAGAGQEQMDTQLDMLGRLMGATKLMDIYLQEEQGLEQKMEAFMNGQYDFRPGVPGKTGKS